MRSSNVTGAAPSLLAVATAAWLALAAAPAHAGCPPPNKCNTKPGCKGVVDECGCCIEAVVPPPSCPAGKTRTPKSRGHCCFPGQGWAGGQCDGRPDACPGDLVPLANDCGPAPLCEGGHVLTADRAHCCWPGQSWDGGACSGTPSCTGGLVAQGTACVAPECSDGRAHAQDGIHCCWPGQHYDGSACAGPPSCPSGFFAAGSECQLEACAAGQEHVDGVHCCWSGQTWSGGCHGPPNCPRAYIRQNETCALESCPEGKTRVDGLHCCWPGQTFDPSAGTLPVDQCVGRPSCPSGWFIPIDLPATGGVEPCQRGGVVDVTGLPPGAMLTVDGLLYMSGTPIAAGPHRLVASAPGYLAAARLFTLGAAGTAQLEVHLEREADPYLPWEITTGVLGAGGTLAGVLCLMAAGDKRDTVRKAAKDGVVDPATLTQRQAKTLEADANTLADAGAATLVIGGVGLATALTLIVVDLASDPATASAQHIELVPIAGAGAQGAVIRLGGSF